MLTYIWPTEPIKSLGIYFGHDKHKCTKLNWKTKTNKIQRLLQTWQKRHLTILGRITIVKTLIIPIVTYSASVITIPERIVKQIETMIYAFIWQNKRDKIKRSTMIGQYSRGGIQMCDIRAHIDALRIKWVKLLIHTDTRNWTLIPSHYLNCYGKNYLIFNMNLDKLTSLSVKQKLPSFYKEVLHAWLKCGGGQTSTPKTFNEIIWGNKFIKKIKKITDFPTVDCK
jgi:hypothetical protein